MNTITFNWEAIITVTGLLTFIFALWKIQRANTKEFQKMQDKSDSHDIEIVELKKSDEKLAVRSDERVKVINGQIEALRSLHMNDVDKITAKIERTFERSTAVEEAHHREVMAKMEVLTEKVTTVCVSFAEHRNNEKQ